MKEKINTRIKKESELSRKEKYYYNNYPVFVLELVRKKIIKRGCYRTYKTEIILESYSRKDLERFRKNVLS